MKLLLKLSFLFGIIVFLGGCANSIPLNNNNLTNTVLKNNSNFAPNQFDFKKIQVGDKILNMTVEYIGPANQNLPMSGDNFNVAFSGQTTISGDYRNNGGSSLGSGVCFFNLDQSSLNNLPVAINVPPQGLAFCLRNDQVVNKDFAPIGSSGHAKVIIDNFSFGINVKGFNMAGLVQMINKK